MKTAPESVKVKIMDRDYVFACAPEEKASLLECVALVDAKMNSIKEMGKLAQIDRIAVMAALMMASDLLALRDGATTTPTVGSTTHVGLDQLQNKIEHFLNQLKPKLGIEEKGLFN